MPERADNFTCITINCYEYTQNTPSVLVAGPVTRLLVKIRRLLVWQYRHIVSTLNWQDTYVDFSRTRFCHYYPMGLSNEPIFCYHTGYSRSKAVESDAFYTAWQCKCWNNVFLGLCPLPLSFLLWLGSQTRSTTSVFLQVVYPTGKYFPMLRCGTVCPSLVSNDCPASVTSRSGVATGPDTGCVYMRACVCSLCSSTEDNL